MRTTIRIDGVEIETNNVEDLRTVMADLGLAHQRRRTDTSVRVASPLPDHPDGPTAAELVAAHARVTLPAEALDAAIDHLDDDDPEPSPLASVHTMEHHRERETVLVPQSMYDVLDVVMQFPEGISTNGVATLLGLTRAAAGNRIQRLKYSRLIERVKGHKMWVATRYARESKLVAA